MRRAGPISGRRSGSNSRIKNFLGFIRKIFLVSKVKTKSSCKTIFTGWKKPEKHDRCMEFQPIFLSKTLPNIQIL